MSFKPCGEGYKCSYEYYSNKYGSLGTCGGEAVAAYGKKHLCRSHLTVAISNDSKSKLLDGDGNIVSSVKIFLKLIDNK